MIIDTVHALKKLTFYGRTTATGVLHLRLRAYYDYGYGRTTTTDTGVRHLQLRACYAYGYGRTSLRLRAYYTYGYGRIAATSTGVLQAYYGLAAGCKLTSGHYNRMAS